MSTTTVKQTVTHKANLATGVMKEEMKDGAYRAATETAVELLAEKVLGLLEKQGGVAFDVGLAVLSTTTGKAGLAWVVGNAILLSEYKNDKLQRLGYELRVYGYSKTFMFVFNMYVKPLVGDLLALVEDFTEEENV